MPIFDSEQQLTMARTKYRYNTESLSYDKIRPSLKKRLLIMTSYLSILLLVGVVGAVVLAQSYRKGEVRE